MTLDDWWEQATDRERDGLVGEAVMGQKVRGTVRDGYYREVDADVAHGLEARDDGSTFVRRPLKQYTTSIAHAWEVVEKIQRSHGPFEIHDHVNGWSDDSPIIWKARFEASGREYTIAETAPEAIALAALRALDVEAPA